jgi:DNA-binding NtrC family response regulator
MYASGVHGYLSSVKSAEVRHAARVLLFEPDHAIAWLLREVLGDEGIEVTSCASLADINTRLFEFPGAVVISDAWSRAGQPDLSDDEQECILDLATRARLIVTTTRQWAHRPEECALGEGITVIAKPFDLDELVSAVKQAGKRAA